MDEPASTTGLNSDGANYGGGLELVADIVSAYVSHNSLRVADLPDLISAVHSSVRGLAGAPKETPPPAAPAVPAVPVKKSVTQDFIICLEDGKKFRSLKRHIGTVYNLSPDQYREKWGLPSDYPMVAPAYSAIRSKLAKDIGLGQPKQSEAATPAPSQEVPAAGSRTKRPPRQR